jgi:CRP-like cAMP-binding protein
MMDLETFEKRHQVFQIGEPAGHVYFLKEGHVKIYRRGRFGRKLTLAVLKPGEVFGELALTAGEVREQGAEAMETTIVCSMTPQDFRALLDRKPTLAFRVIQTLGEQKRTLERKIASWNW